MQISARDHQIANLLQHTCDVSLRDGVQSLYNNCWKIEDLVCIAKKLNEISQIVHAITQEKMIIEVAGGDSFNAALRLKGEDPFDNCARLKAVMPDCRIRSLIRARQLMAFSPVSDEVTTKAIQESVENGVDIFRVVDMLNQVENLLPSIKAIVAYRHRQLDQGVPAHAAVAVELCICYISEPEEQQVVSIDDYIQLGKTFLLEAKKYMRQNDPAIHIAIKDYAGLLDADKLDAIVAGLQINFAHMLRAGELSYLPKITLHTHGDKMALLTKCLTVGADYVDTAIGKLSGGTSHTDIFDFLRAQGESLMDSDASESVLLQKLKETEKLINTLANKYEYYKMPIVALDKINTARMAGGAVQAVQNTLKLQRKNLEIFWQKNGIPKEHFLTESESFDQVLTLFEAIWHRSGRPNTVTPGSKIFSDIAILALMHGRKYANGQVEQSIFPPYKYIPLAYKNLMMGRLGNNQDSVNKIGDPQTRLLRKAFLIEDILSTLLTSELKDVFALHNINAGGLVGSTETSIRFHDVRQMDFEQLAEAGVLETVTENIGNALRQHPNPSIDKLYQRCQIGRIADGYVPYQHALLYAEALAAEGLIRQNEIPRAALLQAMADPNQPNQVRYLYEFRRSGKPPHGSSILDMRTYIAELKGVEDYTLNGKLVPSKQVVNLGELAQKVAAIEMITATPNAPKRYSLFIIKANRIVLDALKEAGFSSELNGTGMGLENGMCVFRELIDECKQQKY